MNREVLDKWLERGILGLVLAILVFAPLATGAVRTLEFLVVQGLTIGAGALWLVRLWAGTGARLLWPPICWAVLAFAGYAVYRYSTADVEYTARLELIRVLVYTAVFFIVLNNVNRQESVQAIGITLVFLALAISAYALYQFASNSQNVWHFTKPEQYGRRAGGTFINPNHLAGWLELVLPIGMAYVLMGRFSHVFKVFLGYACLMVFAGIAVSVSRGGWLASIIMLLVFFACLLRNRRHRLPAALMVVTVGAVATLFTMNSMVFRQRVARTFIEGQLIDIRTYAWQFANQMWKDHFWTGAGPGHFDLRFGEYRLPEILSQVRPVYAHNDYLNTLADWGTVGLTLVAAALVLLVIGIFKTWPHVAPVRSDFKKSRSNRAAFFFGAVLGLLAVALHSVVEFNMQIPAIAITAVSWMAVLSSYRRYEGEQITRTSSIPAKLLATLLLVATLSYLSIQEIRRGQEHRWLAKAEAAKAFPGKKEALLKAAAAEPANWETTYKLGELLREQSWLGENDYEALAKEAMTWFERSIRLNPFNPYSYLRHGMCLDWIGKKEEAGAYFDEAVKRDPNNYYVVAFNGWHLFQLEEYEEARKWFNRSLEIYNNHNHRNQMSVSYLHAIEERLAEQKVLPEPVVP